MEGTAADVVLIIVSYNSTSERRINPSWTLGQLKARLEPITGVPASFQKLLYRYGSKSVQMLEPEETQLSHWSLQAYAEIQVTDHRPPGARENYTDTSGVEKYTLPIADYEARTDSVLAWKKTQKLGRFDPHAPEIIQERTEASFEEVKKKDLKAGQRCRLLPYNDHRRGKIAYVGEIPEIPGSVGAWVGIQLDEPSGKNDGAVNGKRYFKCPAKYGVFVRPERVEAGNFPPYDFESGDEDEDAEF